MTVGLYTIDTDPPISASPTRIPPIPSWMSHRRRAPPPRTAPIFVSNYDILVVLPGLMASARPLLADRRQVENRTCGPSFPPGPRDE